jgi:hypothetical protein
VREDAREEAARRIAHEHDRQPHTERGQEPAKILRDLTSGARLRARIGAAVARPVVHQGLRLLRDAVLERLENAQCIVETSLEDDRRAPHSLQTRLETMTTDGNQRRSGQEPHAPQRRRGDERQ